QWPEVSRSQSVIESSGGSNSAGSARTLARKAIELNAKSIRDYSGMGYNHDFFPTLNQDRELTPQAIMEAGLVDKEVEVCGALFRQSGQIQLIDPQRSARMKA